MTTLRKYIRAEHNGDLGHDSTFYRFSDPDVVRGLADGRAPRSWDHAHPVDDIAKAHVASIPYCATELYGASESDSILHESNCSAIHEADEGDHVVDWHGSLHLNLLSRIDDEDPPWPLVEMVRGLSDYPLADEDDHSHREMEAWNEYWIADGFADALREIGKPTSLRMAVPYPRDPDADGYDHGAHVRRERIMVSAPARWAGLPEWLVDGFLTRWDRMDDADQWIAWSNPIARDIAGAVTECNGFSADSIDIDGGAYRILFGSRWGMPGMDADPTGDAAIAWLADRQRCFLRDLLGPDGIGVATRPPIGPDGPATLHDAAVAILDALASVCGCTTSAGDALWTMDDIGPLESDPDPDPETDTVLRCVLSMWWDAWEHPRLPFADADDGAGASS